MMMGSGQHMCGRMAVLCALQFLTFIHQVHYQSRLALVRITIAYATQQQLAAEL
jgi:hypothetical protein